MEYNSNKLQQTMVLVNRIVSIILCVFLVLLSNKIISDLDTSVSYPSPQDFENKTATADLNAKMSALNVEMGIIQSKKSSIETTIATAKQNYNNEKQSFDNWVQTRTTLGSPDKDQEVTKRAQKLDEYYAIEKQWNMQLDSLNRQLDSRNTAILALQSEQDELNQEANTLYQSALFRFEFKVFMIRLLFVAPILALGIFFFIRRRNHKYSSLFLGFSLFSAYAFFIGLLPYLPSYGGYVHYTIGVLLSVGLGYYAIKTIRQYLDKKQEELKNSNEDRAKNLQSVTIDKALDSHTCPSCGKDFLMKKWELSLQNPTKDIAFTKEFTDYCRHCGLILFKSCKTCGTKGFAHLPFCASCGTSTQQNSAS